MRQAWRTGSVAKRVEAARFAFAAYPSLANSKDLANAKPRNLLSPP
jgi:hypothetical protein